MSLKTISDKIFSLATFRLNTTKGGEGGHVLQFSY